MIPIEKAIIKTTKETVDVKVIDIFEDTKEKVLPDGGVIKFPFRIRIETKEGDIVSEEPTVATLSTTTWKKKFYTKENRVNYTQGYVLLAIIKLMEALKDKTYAKYVASGEFNVNSVVGFKFPAVLYNGEKGKWINWYETFQVHGIEVPSFEDIRGVPIAATTEVANPVKQEKESDLPF